MTAFKQFALDVTWFYWLGQEQRKTGIFRCGESERRRETQRERRGGGPGEGAAGTGGWQAALQDGVWITEIPYPGSQDAQV